VLWPRQPPASAGASNAHAFESGHARRVTTPRFNVDPGALSAALGVLARKRVAVFVVAFQAERFIEGVLDRIPSELLAELAEVFVIDDSSSDTTFQTARAASDRIGSANLRVLRTPSNRGYGGNQKLGYLHAIRSGFDYVVLLHGDSQYAPEYLPQMIEQFTDDEVDAVIGSRMINRRDALRGNMPVYKWIGNQVLTAIQNRTLGSSLSEFHSGYRAYKVDTLKRLPFQLNSDDFHFDTEILIQLIRTGANITEVPVPTFYGDEICNVAGIKYALNCLRAVAKARIAEFGLLYEPKFDFGVFEESGYLVKTAENSLHQWILSQPWDPAWHVADLGANRGLLSAQIARRVRHVTAVDVERPSQAGTAEAVAVDLDGDFAAALGRRRFDVVVALDVLEHLRRPEEAGAMIASILKPGGRLYASTGNIAYLGMRASLLLGQFNYGKRGILDLSHARLFTIGSFERLLQDSGFRITQIHGFGPPIQDMIGKRPVLRAADIASGRLARWWPHLFAFSFLIVAEKEEELDDIYQRTLESERGDAKATHEG
jgi:2-polyprenyl-3-methyl-5-hydroxy-6-metoxy-1,4-benzoquinol methylase